MTNGLLSFVRERLGPEKMRTVKIEAVAAPRLALASSNAVQYLSR